MENSLSNVNFRIDSAVKLKAEELLSELGLNMTTAFNMFLRQLIRERALPFRVALNVPNYSAPSGSDGFMDSASAALDKLYGSPKWDDGRKRPDLRDLVGCLDEDYDPRGGSASRTDG
ncbi:MAG: type II toxin-antitoxin system RelB/DinJ family antitoxin [Oscillospiraceae bacterium]|jgi:addiction module RelB/DinJ family antitoxin|nr:type II toxin-antitoxin system RelB/DinJ family antitoxin [Oscillospiraceae bacterium]